MGKWALLRLHIRPEIDDDERCLLSILGEEAAAAAANGHSIFMAGAVILTAAFFMPFCAIKAHILSLPLHILDTSREPDVARENSGSWQP